MPNVVFPSLRNGSFPVKSLSVSISLIGSIFYMYESWYNSLFSPHSSRSGNLSSDLNVIKQNFLSSWKDTWKLYFRAIKDKHWNVAPSYLIENSAGTMSHVSPILMINGPSTTSSSLNTKTSPSINPILHPSTIHLSPSSNSPLPLPSAPVIIPPVPMGIAASALISCIASCAAETVSYPFDFAKTRLQIQSDAVKDGKKLHSSSIVSRFHGMSDVLKRVPRESQQGMFALYSGLRPALLRQATYGTIKVVVYERSKHMLEHTAGMTSSVQRQLLAGVLAGALSSAICNPIDLIKVRMAGGDRIQYTTCLNSFRHIIKEEGFLALYKGVVPTTQRAVLITLLNLPTYDIAKEFLLARDYRDSILAHFLASSFAGLISTYGSNPIDTVKSRIMNQPVDATGKGLLYRNSFHCAVRTVQEEGLLALWKGSVPNCCRNVPWLIIFWCSYEALKGVVQKLEKK